MRSHNHQYNLHADANFAANAKGPAGVTRKGKLSMTNAKAAKVSAKSKCAKSTRPKPDGSLSEHQIQSCFFDWVRLSVKTHPELRLCVAIPNAAKRSPGLATWLKREGLIAGVPDVLLMVPRGIWSGLAIEFKRPGGKISPAQDAIIHDMRVEGWRVCILYSTEEAITVVKEYLEVLGG